MTEAEQSRLEQLAHEAADRLREHFDSVRIFATAESDDGTCNTISFTTGRGNIHAQFGQAQLWVERMLAFERADAVRDADEDS